MPHTLQWIFIGIAVALILLAILLFAWALFTKRNRARAEAARLEDIFEGACHAYRQLEGKKEQGTIDEAAFEEEANRLAGTLVDDLAETSDARAPQTSVLLWGTLLALIVAIPAGGAGLYLRYGDYSALDDRAVAQIDAVKTEEERARSMGETMAVLEEAVKKDPNRLEAWEILADQYTITEEWPKAIAAWQEVVRLKPNDVPAAVNLMDAIVASGEVDEKELGALVKKILALDPHEGKTLVLAGILNYQEGKYAEAVLYWNRLRTQVPEGDEMREVLDENIERAMKEGGLKQLPLDTVEPPKPVMMPKGMPGMGGGMGSGMGPGMGGMPPNMPPNMPPAMGSGSGAMRSGMGGISGLPPLPPPKQ